MRDRFPVTTPEAVAAALPANEAARIAALERLALLDTEPEIAFNDIVQLAATVCDTPIALVSLIDRDRQWFKARIGLDATQTHRDLAFCAHAILQPEALTIVLDATADARFSGNPLVTDEPGIRFYAGAPLRSPDGHALGTLCVIDTKPRSLDDKSGLAPFTAAQQQGLLALARQATALIQLRELGLARARQNHALRQKITMALADTSDADEGLYARLRHEQRVNAVGQLASGIAHDFNNLLQTISTSLQLVQRKAEQAEHVRRWANSGMLAVEHGASLVSQLLAFSRNRTDGEDHEAAQPVCCVDATIERIEDLLARVLGPEIRLTFALNAGTACIDCAATQIEAAMMNMVINARDAMRNVGSIRITTMRTRVDAVPHDGASASIAGTAVSGGAVGDVTPSQGDAMTPPLAEGDYVMLQVSDSGPGMPEDVAARAFEPFFTTKPANKGTGLGLAQVQAAALKAGGTARIDASPHTGTTVTLWLRISTADEMSALVASTETSQAMLDGVPPAIVVGIPPSADPPPQPPRVLLVDDQRDLRTALAALLEEAGFVVEQVESGLAALQQIDLSIPDIVISDCAMHGFNGALLGRVLGAMHPRLPILFMTGHINLDLVRADLPAEAILLRKPIVIDALITRIDAALQALPNAERFTRYQRSDNANVVGPAEPPIASSGMQAVG
ncbi:response regulator [Robbsia andropogonis]|uniref:response regulator n=1 Tax=Robbsia andropogonis TaxID=28092 RepID=UPI0006971C41|nr:response regulator [Robbsia andropogonis]